MNDKNGWADAPAARSQLARAKGDHLRSARRLKIDQFRLDSLLPEITELLSQKNSGVGIDHEKPDLNFFCSAGAVHPGRQ